MTHWKLESKRKKQETVIPDVLDMYMNKNYKQTEDGSSRFLRSVGNKLHEYTPSQPKRQ
jgi:hypothetical protein